MRNCLWVGHVYSLPGSTVGQQMPGWNPICVSHWGENLGLKVLTLNTANNVISGGNPTSARYDAPLGGNSQTGHWYPAPHQSNERSRGSPALTSPYDLHLRNAQAGDMHSTLHYPVADSFVSSPTGTSNFHSAGQRPSFDAQPHTGHGQVPASGGGSSQNTAARSKERRCTACGTKHTSIWRRDPPNSGRTGALVCNKCGMVRRRMSEKVAAHRGRLQG
ncbi:hypothetical protein FB45DRAFT_389768 [Roridomyces roridus]|uniref:GATA-type domain-containing protein n=1 Tax=Roridomyces roridus TaxID=1738132 RepID=A0AAD7B1Z7_9AGAR|nr:hypothetical protein FB45DRAFT_389768 [Roridomyces roridus]